MSLQDPESRSRLLIILAGLLGAALGLALVVYLFAALLAYLHP